MKIKLYESKKFIMKNIVKEFTFETIKTIFNESIRVIKKFIKYIKKDEEEQEDEETEKQKKTICPLRGEPCFTKDCNWWNKDKKKCLIVIFINTFSNR